jgi:2-keto-3-deoxy-L-rhamnonate aldolase RhmA
MGHLEGERVHHIANLKRKVKSGELVLCISLLHARTADAPVIAAASGADCIYVDLEHGTTSLETAALLSAAAIGAGIAPLVRVPHGAFSMATRALDAGAVGIILPHVDTAEQAREAMRELRFAPNGRRSFGGVGMPAHYKAMPMPEMIDRLGMDITVAAMIETEAAVVNAAAIAAEEGIDILLVGTSDLCIDLGLPGQAHHERIGTAFRAVAEACKRAGKCFGVGGIRNDPDYFNELMRLGARFLIIGSDAGYLALGIRNDVDVLRGREAAS